MTVDCAAPYGLRTKYEKETQEFLQACKKQISVETARKRDLPLNVRSLEDYFYSLALTEEDKALYEELCPSKTGHKTFPKIPVCKNIKNILCCDQWQPKTKIVK